MMRIRLEPRRKLCDRRRVRFRSPALLVSIALAVACGRTRLGDMLIDDGGAADDDDGGGDDSGSGRGGRGGSARGGQSTGGANARGGVAGKSGMGGSAAAGRGGRSAGGFGGQAAAGGGGVGGRAGAAGMAGVAGIAGMAGMPNCGNGVVDPGEACDPGAEPPLPALEVRQGTLRRPVQPLVGAVTANEFYAYGSRSGHTGFEAVNASRMYLYRWRPEAAMSLVMHHGIDEDSTGMTQPDASVVFEIAGLPSTGVVALSDDDVEFVRSTPTTASAAWNFRENTDGGVLAGLPFPGNWQLTVTPVLFREVTDWKFLSGSGSDVTVVEELPLDLTKPVEIVASERRVMCRADCTLPRCGDGRLDPGEICDDGNALTGDGCSDCKPDP
jgi:cysteine-rich repeat protein